MAGKMMTVSTMKEGRLVEVQVEVMDGIAVSKKGVAALQKEEKGLALEVDPETARFFAAGRVGAINIQAES